MKVLVPRDGRVGGGWLTLFAAAWLAVWTVQLTPVQLLLPLQLDTPGGENDWITGVIWSGLILSVGGIAGVIAGPVAGMLSDRTGSVAIGARWGRRRPWAIGGAVLTAASLLLTGSATEPLEVGAAWIGVSVGIAVISAALTAMIADQVFAQRGTASAFVSSAQAVGVVVGVGAVVLLGLGIGASYVVLAGFILVVGIGAAALLPDPPAVWTKPATRAGWRERMGVLRDPDLMWVLSSRLTVNIGNALGTALLLFFLLYGVGSSAASAEDDLLVLIVIYTIFVVVASLVAGGISDRTGRRKQIVIIAALVQALSAVMILISPTFIGTSIAAAVMGIGYGAYMAVSLALATDLLPRVEDHARDLGIVNVSASLGQLLGPLLGAGLVALVGGFWLLFLAAGVLSALGAVMTIAIRPDRASRPPRPAMH